MKKIKKFEWILMLIGVTSLIVIISIVLFCVFYFGHFPKTYIDNDPVTNNLQVLGLVFFISYVILHLIVLILAIYQILNYLIKKKLNRITLGVEIVLLLFTLFLHFNPLRIFVLWIAD